MNRFDAAGKPLDEDTRVGGPSDTYLKWCALGAGPNLPATLTGRLGRPAGLAVAPAGPADRAGHPWPAALGAADKLVPHWGGWPYRGPVVRTRRGFRWWAGGVVEAGRWRTGAGAGDRRRGGPAPVKRRAPRQPVGGAVAAGADDPAGRAVDARPEDRTGDLHVRGPGGVVPGVGAKAWFGDTNRATCRNSPTTLPLDHGGPMPRTPVRGARTVVSTGGTSGSRDPCQWCRCRRPASARRPQRS